MNNETYENGTSSNVVTNSTTADATVQIQSGTQTPNVADLQAQITRLMAEREKMKSAFDKSASEAADYKKKLREKLTAEEAEAEARREAEEAQRETLNNLTHELSVMKATTRYLKQGMSEDMAKECAELEASGDMDALMDKVFKNNGAAIENAVKNAQDKWLSERPNVNAGHGEDNGGKEDDDPFLKGFNNKK